MGMPQTGRVSHVAAKKRVLHVVIIVVIVVAIVVGIVMAIAIVGKAGGEGVSGTEALLGSAKLGVTGGLNVPRLPVLPRNDRADPEALAEEIPSADPGTSDPAWGSIWFGV